MIKSNNIVRSGFSFILNLEVLLYVSN